MEKNILKWYEAPQVEVVEMEVQGILCSSPEFNDDDDSQVTGGAD